MNVRLHAEALLDIDEAALWYEEQEPGLGDEFLAELNGRFAALVEQPTMWPLWPGTRAGKYPVRRRLLARFPYAIAYQVLGDTIVIVAVAADKKRPRFWESRVSR